MKLAVLFFIFFSNAVHSRIEETCKKILNNSELRQFRNIDFIYIINFSERPEKHQHSLEQLASYGIIPYRFSAVNGWNLPSETIKSMRVSYKSRIQDGIWGTSYSITNNKNPFYEVMQEEINYFCHDMSKRATKIALSHLPILQDAYDSGYEMTWVMEDDIEVIGNPHVLSDRIDELDQLEREEGWDILFKDQNTKGQNGRHVICSSCAPRSNFSPFKPKKCVIKHNISRNLRYIEARYGAYFMIVRRSEMEKFLTLLRTTSFFSLLTWNTPTLIKSVFLL